MQKKKKKIGSLRAVTVPFLLQFSLVYLSHNQSACNAAPSTSNHPAPAICISHPTAPIAIAMAGAVEAMTFII
jgi:hypothetical protein